jgi:protein-disulfide isomerase
MSNTADGKKARREHAREVARQEREAAQRRRKRNRLLVQGGVIVALLAAVTVVTLVIINATTTTTVNPKNMASDGILFTGDGTTLAPVTTKALPLDADPTPTDTSALDAAVNIVTYIDYACPICQTFETTNAEQITGWVTSGEASLEIHPISILDRVSLGTKYSSRAANAAVCVANYDPDNYMAVNDALFAQQPEENTSGLDTAALKTLVAGAGANSDEVASCIDDKTFGDWVTNATDRVTSGELASDTVTEFVGTPTVLVNGELYQGAVDDPEAFASFVAQVAGEATLPAE